jgi:hypothetical protein
MTDLWYQKPNVLLDDMFQFFPTNDLSRTEKINALARFALYYALIIIVLDQNQKWLSISVVLLIVSYCLGYYENFEQTGSKKDSNCTAPTKTNPFMNFTVGDYMKDVNRTPACSYDKVKDKMREEFRRDIVPDPADLWGTNISDRQFFTMPWTTVVNNQSGFAKWLYGNSGECKNLGLNCDKNRDNRYHQSRYYMQY